MPEENQKNEEKLEFLKRGEIRTMRKDIAHLREIEAQKERERITTLKTTEEIRERRERLEKLKKGEETKKRKTERLKLERELKEILEEKEPLEIKRNELFKNNTQLEKILRIILAKEVEIEKKERIIEEKEKVSSLPEEKHKLEKERWNAEEERRKIESERWLQEEELKKNKVQLKEADLQYQQILKKEEEIKSSLKRLEEAKEIKPEKMEREGEIKKEEVTRVPPESLIPKPFPKKPSLFKKVLVRGVIVLLLLLVFSLFYWFFWAKKPPEEKVLPPAEEEIVPPEEEITEKPEISIPPSLISVTETKTWEISQNEEIPGMIYQLMNEELPLENFTRMVIKNTEENRLASLEDLSQAFQIEAPEEIFQKLEPDYTLSLYSQGQGKRVVFVAKIKEEGLPELLKAWELKLEKGISISGKELSPLVPYFKAASYQGVTFRYQTFSENDSGICYSIFNDYFVLTSSGESMLKIIDKLSEYE
jgi:hypothetical protein